MMLGQLTLQQLLLLLLVVVLLLLLLCRHAAVEASTVRARASEKAMQLLKLVVVVVKAVLSVERVRLVLAFELAHTMRHVLLFTATLPALPNITVRLPAS
jgi:hypothetical protein